MNKNNSTTTPSPSPGPTTKATAGVKRKRGPTAKYYAVKRGFIPGVYFNWNDCLAQVTGFKNADFKTFPSIDQANSFIKGEKINASAGNGEEPTRFYGVQRGRVPGVYLDWTEAQAQIVGFVRPRFKKFESRREAEEFVAKGQEAKKDAPAPVPGTTTTNPKDADGEEVAAGIAPLPPNAEDGFDPNVLLEPATGKVVYRTPDQKAETKTQPTAPPGMLRIYTDGSSLGNGYKGAQAGVGVYFGPGDTSRNVSEPLKGSRQTNQRAELTAILRALEIAPRHRPVTIVTDSRYAIDCVTSWFKKWIRNNWQTSDGRPVENKDLVKAVLVKINERESLNVTTSFEWVKGHNRDFGNEEADKLAVHGARKGAAGVSTAGAVVEDDIPDELADEVDDL
ncbi:ribonuclease HI [Talaromyces islandicus]|uniref:Ribonuclease H n=1 Tax=Talaromyces islandicus TaxID=28573 RepID=A0A0U1LJK0_TALIS|nr:ribonuclease HI [Talaromyces islandicus]